MRTRLAPLTTRIVIAAGALLVLAAPANAAPATAAATRPWHYWIAPFLLSGAVLLLAALGIGYYVRVMGGRGRR